MTTATARGSSFDYRRFSSGTLFVVGLMIPIGIFVVVQLARDPELFAQTLLKALGLGSTYAIIALGFVLIFKATQVVNFAQGSLGVSGALFLSFLASLYPAWRASRIEPAEVLRNE